MFIDLDAASMDDGALQALKDTIHQYSGRQAVILQIAGHNGSRRVALGPNYMVNCTEEFPIRVRRIKGVTTLWQEDVVT